MKRHELIQALRQYTTHSQLQGLLGWPEDHLRGLLKYYTSAPTSFFSYNFPPTPMHARVIGFRDSWGYGFGEAEIKIQRITVEILPVEYYLGLAIK